MKDNLLPMKKPLSEALEGSLDSLEAGVVCGFTAEGNIAYSTKGKIGDQVLLLEWVKTQLLERLTAPVIEKADG